LPETTPKTGLRYDDIKIETDDVKLALDRLPQEDRLLRCAILYFRKGVVLCDDYIFFVEGGRERCLCVGRVASSARSTCLSRRRF
jgi:hypothetical protein